jgi:hypothetical protein
MKVYVHLRYIAITSLNLLKFTRGLRFRISRFTISLLP